MFDPITIRFPKPMAREIEALVAKYADEGMDKSSVIRRLVKFGLEAESRGGYRSPFAAVGRVNTKRRRHGIQG